MKRSILFAQPLDGIPRESVSAVIINAFQYADDGEDQSLTHMKSGKVKRDADSAGIHDK